MYIKKLKLISVILCLLIICSPLANAACSTDPIKRKQQENAAYDKFIKNIEELADKKLNFEQKQRLIKNIAGAEYSSTFEAILNERTELEKPKSTAPQSKNNELIKIGNVNSEGVVNSAPEISNSNIRVSANELEYEGAQEFVEERGKSATEIYNNLESQGLGPKHKFTIGNQIVYTSNTFNLEPIDGRLGAIIYVVGKNGETSMRLAYKSESSNEWRVASGLIIKDRTNLEVSWIGKGNDEYSMTLKIGMSNYLDSLTTQYINDFSSVLLIPTQLSYSIKRTVYQPLALEESLAVNFKELESQVFDTSSADFIANSFGPASEKKIFDSQDNPNFKDIISDNTAFNQKYNSDIRTVTVKSNNENILYRFHHVLDQDITWLGSAELVNSEINGYGVNNIAIPLASIAEPGIEYRYKVRNSQGGIKDIKTHFDGNYYLNTDYTHNIPIVKDFRKEILNIETINSEEITTDKNEITEDILFSTEEGEINFENEQEIIITFGNTQLKISEGETKAIGRAPTNDLEVLDITVSRKHATISMENGILYITDLESSVGTFVNDAKIGKGKIEINPGDSIKLGLANLKIESVQNQEEDEIDFLSNTGTTGIFTDIKTNPITAPFYWTYRGIKGIVNVINPTKTTPELSTDLDSKFDQFIIEQAKITKTTPAEFEDTLNEIGYGLTVNSNSEISFVSLTTTNEVPIDIVHNELLTQIEFDNSLSEEMIEINDELDLFSDEKIDFDSSPEEEIKFNEENIQSEDLELDFQDRSLARFKSDAILADHSREINLDFTEYKEVLAELGYRVESNLDGTIDYFKQETGRKDTITSKTEVHEKIKDHLNIGPIDTKIAELASSNENILENNKFIGAAIMFNSHANEMGLDLNEYEQILAEIGYEYVLNEAGTVDYFESGNIITSKNIVQSEVKQFIIDQDLETSFEDTSEIDSLFDDEIDFDDGLDLTETSFEDTISDQNILTMNSQAQKIGIDEIAYKDALKELGYTTEINKQGTIKYISSSPEIKTNKQIEEEIKQKVEEQKLKTAEQKNQENTKPKKKTSWKSRIAKSLAGLTFIFGITTFFYKEKDNEDTSSIISGEKIKWEDTLKDEEITKKTTNKVKEIVKNGALPPKEKEKITKKIDSGVINTHFINQNQKKKIDEGTTTAKEIETTVNENIEKEKELKTQIQTKTDAKIIIAKSSIDYKQKLAVMNMISANKINYETILHTKVNCAIMGACREDCEDSWTYYNSDCPTSQICCTS